MVDCITSYATTTYGTHCFVADIAGNCGPTPPSRQRVRYPSELGPKSLQLKTRFTSHRMSRNFPANNRGTCRSVVRSQTHASESQKRTQPPKARSKSFA